MGDIADALRRAVSDGEEPSSPPSGKKGARSPTMRAVPPPVVEEDWVETPIPTSRDARWMSRVVWVAGREASAAAFRHLALRIRSECEERGTSTVLITSTVAQEGKTLTACNLALALASMQAGGRIALVDLDLRAPAVAASIGIRPRLGFEKVLLGEAPARSAALRTEVALDVYPVAQAVRDAHEVLARPTVAECLAQLAARYRFVICDAPPLLPVPDVELLIPHVGSCCAVVRSGRTSRSALTELADRVPRDKLIGCFLNDARLPRHYRHYYRLEYGAETGAPRQASGSVPA